MPKFESNPTEIDTTYQRDLLAEASELAGQVYSHIRGVVRTSGGERKHQKQQAKEKCAELLKLLERV